MGTPNSILARRAPARPVSHYALINEGAGWYRLVIVDDGLRTEQLIRGLADVRRYLTAMHPGAIEVPLAFFEPDHLAPVRTSGTVWGQIDALNDRDADSHRAYCRTWPREAQSTSPPPGHAEAFRASYEEAFAAEMRGRRGGK